VENSILQHLKEKSGEFYFTTPERKEILHRSGELPERKEILHLWRIPSVDSVSC